MPPKAINWRLYGKMAAAGAICCIGGPALIIWVSPTEEELFLKYNPDLQKRSLANRVGRQQDFDDFVGKLKEYSKSDKPIWEAAAIAEKQSRDGKILEQVRLSEEIEARKKEIRDAGIKPIPGGSL
ncbi:CBP4-domain-containing protein [Hyaloscypha variabilis F]|uniref:Cytochrome b mRNA-processing protein 4 n=1 Tax=Hyaloscypha variabilis (strain UAMH 11265 / GT02V1 / F) TaxID=1149755 RepID=A0A2J6R3Z5_HYAVF|nr:CBP4-domain-containing protein [Hyaloscypha variabilis F]